MHQLITNRRSLIILIIIMLALPIVMGCPVNIGGKQSKSFFEMSPKEKITFARNFYISQWDDYQKMTSNKENLSESLRKVLRARRQMIVNLETAINTYDEFFVENPGLPPPYEKEQAIYSLMNMIANQAVK